MIWMHTFTLSSAVGVAVASVYTVGLYVDGPGAKKALHKYKGTSVDGVLMHQGVFDGKLQGRWCGQCHSIHGMMDKGEVVTPAVVPTYSHQPKGTVCVQGQSRSRAFCQTAALGCGT